MIVGRRVLIDLSLIAARVSGKMMGGESASLNAHVRLSFLLSLSRQMCVSSTSVALVSAVANVVICTRTHTRPRKIRV